MTTTRTTTNKDRRVAVWLLCCCAMVYCMVVLGGVTRLTGSGLSIVDWHPIVGILPPLSDEAWQRSFEEYQQSPEFRKVNSQMDVSDYKSIFWLEYLHRLLGRLIGLVFFVPFVVFVAKGFIERRAWPKYSLMFVLGGLQGLLGWYMVKSGLVDNPHVSQYRLTAHLIAALAIYAYMFWVALSLLFPAPSVRRHVWFRPTLALTAVALLTIVSGGFVAGLKAGHIYNTFPLMGNSFVPPALWAMSPGWRNLFENATTAQFDHRLLAITTFLLIVGYWIAARRAVLPPRAQKAANIVLVLAVLQVSLGISTLLLSVPIALGAGHQATAVLLFTSLLVLLHSVQRV